MKTKDELKKIDIPKLLQELKDSEKELFKIKFDIENGQAKNSHDIRKWRKQVARIKTILAEKTK